MWATMRPRAEPRARLHDEVGRDEATEAGAQQQREVIERLVVGEPRREEERAAALAVGEVPAERDRGFGELRAPGIARQATRASCGGAAHGASATILQQSRCISCSVGAKLTSAAFVCSTERPSSTKFSSSCSSVGPSIAMSVAVNQSMHDSSARVRSSFWVRTESAAAAATAAASVGATTPSTSVGPPASQRSICSDIARSAPSSAALGAPSTNAATTSQPSSAQSWPHDVRYSRTRSASSTAVGCSTARRDDDACCATHTSSQYAATTGAAPAASGDAAAVPAVHKIRPCRAGAKTGAGVVVACVGVVQLAGRSERIIGIPAGGSRPKRVR